jgi:hypothetical protein
MKNSGSVSDIKSQREHRIAIDVNECLQARVVAGGRDNLIAALKRSLSPDTAKATRRAGDKPYASAG